VTFFPHTWDKHERKLKPNQEFLNLHSMNAANVYDPKEVEKEMPKLAEKIKKDRQSKQDLKAKLHKSVEYAGTAETGIKRVIGKASS